MRISTTLLIVCFLAWSCNSSDSWIRINQLGYAPSDIKNAVFISTRKTQVNNFQLIDTVSGKKVRTFSTVREAAAIDQFVSCYRLDFSDFSTPGVYRIRAGGALSPAFRIDKNVYDGTADYLLNYMRQQRCGYNPFLSDSCHTEDGYEIYGKGDSAHVDVRGGWHDAADYLQYVATSANAVYQMLFAWSENPSAFGDNYKADGHEGADGIPDVLNESMWGLEWLLRMNPDDEVMYNQIADDRDHVGFRLPVGDKADYGKGSERPVYRCTGKPQGVLGNLNRATGIASTAGKFASAFAIASKVYRESNPELSKTLEAKAEAAFSYGLKNPGVCQTAPGSAPYFYEEDNWTDDMELAAAELFNLTGDSKYMNHAEELGRKEPFTPWMGADTARHYQWYPFVNMGHPAIARHNGSMKEFAGFMKEGLERVRQKGEKNPFLVGVPFIWCSNNLVAGLITQARLYRQITGDETYARMEAAHRDWLFGCNPWGTSMVVGLPMHGDYPEKTHSSYVVKGMQVWGGLVDGPVYSSIFRAHSKYVGLRDDDPYAPFQTKMANYHDDIGDYTSNECTMDGTACLVYYLSAMQSDNMKQNMVITRGAVTRMDTTRKEIWLVFTAHDFKDGFPVILDELDRRKISASFFLTGDFCRNPENSELITRLVKAGHYIGPHSGKHLLYCPWENRDSLLVTKKEFEADLEDNMSALGNAGVKREDVKVFLPPYEWHNDSIAAWTSESGLKLVNISSGTIVSQDWTFPAPGNRYFTSDSLMKNLVSYESRKGLKGYILLIHPGTDPRRPDKFYLRLGELLTYLEGKNYKFRSFYETNLN